MLRLPLLDGLSRFAAESHKYRLPRVVGIAAGPEARLYRDGLEEYGKVLRRILRAT